MLKQQNSKICIFIEIPVLKKMYECRVQKSSTFLQCLHLMNELLYETHTFYEIDDEVIIIEKKSMQICDKNISLSHLHACNGMTFLLF